MHTFKKYRKKFSTLNLKFKISNFLVSLLLFYRLQIFVQGAEEFLQDLDRQQNNTGIEQSTVIHSHKNIFAIEKEKLNQEIINTEITHILPKLSFDSEIIMQCDSIINENQKYNEDNMNTNISSSVVQASNFNNYEEGNHHNYLNFNAKNNKSVNEYYNMENQNHKDTCTFPQSSYQNAPNNPNINLSQNYCFYRYNQNYQNNQNKYLTQNKGLNLNYQYTPNNQYYSNKNSTQYTQNNPINNLGQNDGCNQNYQYTPNNQYYSNQNLTQKNQYTQNYQNGKYTASDCFYTKKFHDNQIFKNAEQESINFTGNVYRNDEISKYSHQTNNALIHDNKRKLQNFSDYYNDFTYQNPLISHEISSFSKYSNVPLNYYSNSITNNGIVINSQSSYVNSESADFGNNQFFTQNYQQSVTSSDNCPKLQQNNINNISKITEMNQMNDSAADNIKDSYDSQENNKCSSEKKIKTQKEKQKKTKKIKKNQKTPNTNVRKIDNKFIKTKKSKIGLYKKQSIFAEYSIYDESLLTKKFKSNVDTLFNDITNNDFKKNKDNLLIIFTAATIYSLLMFSDTNWSDRIKNNLLIEIYELIKNKKFKDETKKNFALTENIYEIFKNQYDLFMKDDDLCLYVAREYIIKKLNYLERFVINSSLKYIKNENISATYYSKELYKDKICYLTRKLMSENSININLYNRIISDLEYIKEENILEYASHKHTYLQYYLRIFLKIFFSQENYEKSKIIYDTKIKKECEEKAIKTYFSILLRDYSLNLNKSYPKECDLINEFILEYEGK